MKKFFVSFLIIFFSANIWGQNITESLIHLRKKYNPFFSSESSVLSFEFIKNYELGGVDTSYWFIINVDKKMKEVTSVSVGSSIFGASSILGFAGNASVSSEIIHSEGKTVMSRKKFDEFYSCTSKVYTFVNQRKLTASENINTLATCSVENLVLGGEYDPDAFQNKVKYYFLVEDDANFKMDHPEFTNILHTVRDIKLAWDKAINRRP